MECDLPCSLLGGACKGVDLSYPLHDGMVCWPGGERFQLCMECTTSTEHGYVCAAGTFSCAEHSGTHVDAPFHFAPDGITVDKIALSDLIGPCRVIDISASCCNESDRDYALSCQDILLHEQQWGEIEERCIVLVRTGWSRFWELGAKAYLGYDEAAEGPYDENRSKLHFPGISREAADMLVQRKVVAVGLDTGKTLLLQLRIVLYCLILYVFPTASLDPGCRQDFAAHRALLGAGVYGIENINAGIELLPAVGATLWVLPMKIVGGSGAPARVVACIPASATP